jgi:hypothetical protein
MALCGPDLKGKTTVTESETYDLSSLFGAALQTMVENRQEVNDLDGYNGNHGDNMVENLRIINDAVSTRSGRPPAEALRYASHELQARGRGSTSQYYAEGLDQAAERLEGRSGLNQDDVMSLVQSMLGAVPAEGQPQQSGADEGAFGQALGLSGGQQPQAGGDVFGQLLGLSGGQQPQVDEDVLGQALGLSGGQQPQADGDVFGQLLGLSGSPQPGADEDALGQAFGIPGGQAPQGGGDVLGQLLGGLAGGQAPQGGGSVLGQLLGGLAGAQQPQAGSPEGGQGLGGLLGTLLPAALAFLQAKQSGADTGPAVGQALMSVLTGGQANPLEVGTPHAAAGGLVAQSILQTLVS